jgi:hypothetical protein
LHWISSGGFPGAVLAPLLVAVAAQRASVPCLSYGIAVAKRTEPRAVCCSHMIAISPPRGEVRASVARHDDLFERREKRHDRHPYSGDLDRRFRLAFGAAAKRENRF